MAGAHFHSEYSINGRDRGIVSPPSNGKRISDHPAVQAENLITVQVTQAEFALIQADRLSAFKHDPILSGAQSAPAESNGQRIGLSGRPEWMPMPVSKLPSEGESVPWVWGGYIARGHITSLTGLWKSGKTTLLKYLLKSLEGSSTTFCGQAIIAAKSLVISEESAMLWANRRDDLLLSDRVHLLNKPFKMGRPRIEEWITFIATISEHQKTQIYDLIVFDSMHNLWGVGEENDNAEILRYLTPLNLLTDSGAAVLLVAHPTKADSGEGRATRGGGAWGGFVDVILEMRRHDSQSDSDTRRVLTAYSRWEDTTSNLVIELDKDAGEYRVVGTKADANAEDRMSVYYSLLPRTEPGMTPDEVYSAWPGGSILKPGTKTIRRELDQAFEKGTLRRKGEGVKGDPHRYSILDTIDS